jgi:hypothetical protein
MIRTLTENGSAGIVRCSKALLDPQRARRKTLRAAVGKASILLQRAVETSLVKSRA